jgi:hypothetical protein
VKSAAFGLVMTALYIFYVTLDSSDDEFYKSPDLLKYFVRYYELSIFSFQSHVFGIGNSKTVTLQLAFKVYEFLFQEFHVSTYSLFIIIYIILFILWTAVGACVSGSYLFLYDVLRTRFGK